MISVLHCNVKSNLFFNEAILLSIVNDSPQVPIAALHHGHEEFHGNGAISVIFND